MDSTNTQQSNAHTACGALQDSFIEESTKLPESIRVGEVLSKTWIKAFDSKLDMLLFKKAVPYFVWSLN